MSNKEFNTIGDRLTLARTTVETLWRKQVIGPEPMPDRLLQAIEYSLLSPGKCLRPALVLECWRACREQHGQDDSAAFADIPRTLDTDTPAAVSFHSAAAAALAIELIHAFSLVHDDLPAMDDDDLRRGRPTNHKVFGEAVAILAGDAMVTLAFQILARHARMDLVPALVTELAHAAGPCGMIGGQVLDIESEHQSLTLDELQRVHRMKTGALLTCACRLGAIAAGADAATLTDLTDFGRHLGLAFQIVDDVLDETATPQQLGKATQKDAARGKNTYPHLMGIEAARAEANRQFELAQNALSRFGPRGELLSKLARFVVMRIR